MSPINVRRISPNKKFCHVPGFWDMLHFVHDRLHQKTINIYQKPRLSIWCHHSKWPTMFSRFTHQHASHISDKTTPKPHLKNQHSSRFCGYIVWQTSHNHRWEISKYNTFISVDFLLNQHDSWSYGMTHKLMTCMSHANMSGHVQNTMVTASCRCSLTKRYNIHTLAWGYTDMDTKGCNIHLNHTSKTNIHNVFVDVLCNRLHQAISQKPKLVKLLSMRWFGFLLNQHDSWPYVMTHKRMTCMSHANMSGHVQKNTMVTISCQCSPCRCSLTKCYNIHTPAWGYTDMDTKGCNIHLNHMSKTNIHHVFADAVRNRLHTSHISKTKIHQVIVEASD